VTEPEPFSMEWLYGKPFVNELKSTKGAVGMDLRNPGHPRVMTQEDWFWENPPADLRGWARSKFPDLSEDDFDRRTPTSLVREFFSRKLE